MKIFTLNDTVIVNEKGGIVFPELRDKVGTVIKLHDENTYAVEFDGIGVFDFIDLELNHHTVSEKPKQFDYEEKSRQLGKLVADKQTAYGNSVDSSFHVMKAFLERYKYHDGYRIPEELLQHILLMVRIIDKQNRIFSNPQGDLMGESPYVDIQGYSLLGQKMVEGHE